MLSGLRSSFIFWYWHFKGDLRQQEESDGNVIHFPRKRLLTAGKYGKGFSFVLRRGEIPFHRDEECLELVVTRLSNPTDKLKLYAQDNRKRDFHFVATQLNPAKNDSFLAESIRVVGITDVINGYNQDQPPSLENTRLGLVDDGMVMEIDSARVRLGGWKLQGYGAYFGFVANYPDEFPQVGPEQRKLLIGRDGRGSELG
jgi:hypothetical protein